MKPLITTILLASLAPGLRTEALIPAEALLADLAIARDAYTTLHPGLFRYNSPEQIATGFDELETRFADGLSLRETYLAFAELLAGFRCGHTYANFWNQSEDVQDLLFRGSDKLPFNFRVIDDQLVVTHNATNDPRVRPGTVITSLNTVPTGDLLERLTSLMHADGSGDHQRRFELQVTGIGEFEPFDVYQPLLYPPADGRYSFGAIDVTTGKPFTFSADAMSRDQRKRVLEERLGPLEGQPDSLWSFALLDEATAYLQAGSFVTWKMKLDWRGFLEDAFSTLQERKIDRLILDVRGNGGGDDDVLDALLRHLLAKPVTVPASRELVRYNKVPEHLTEVLDTWDDSFFDRTGKVRPVGDGFYAADDASSEPKVITGGEGAFAGRVVLLVDPANSSATFTLARILKDSGRATLVGQTTGGNRRGINGGQIFFLRLPNSALEMDIPLIGYYPLGEQPDSGVVPDVQILPSIEGISSGIDSALEAALKVFDEDPESE